MLPKTVSLDVVAFIPSSLLITVLPMHSPSDLEVLVSSIMSSMNEGGIGDVAMCGGTSFPFDPMTGNSLTKKASPDSPNFM